MARKKKKVSSARGEGMASNRTGVDMRHPPARRLPGPIIDAHTHVASPPIAALFVEAARTYHIDRVFAISSLQDAAALRKKYGTFFEFYFRPSYEEIDRPRRFKKISRERIDQAAEAGFIALKFWFKPTFNHEQKLFFNDRRMYPIYEKMAEHGLPGLIHIADPDIWFERVYTDKKKYGTKAENYDQFTKVFRDFPEVTFLGAHFGGDPENLDHLQQLLDDFPNFIIDVSATKWVAREISRQTEKARDFICRNADRILFGTDLVTFDGITSFERYASRYWVHQMLWESAVRTESPIDDTDSRGKPKLRGLALPDSVLEKLYWRNAVRYFRIRKPRVRTAIPRTP